MTRRSVYLGLATIGPAFFIWILTRSGLPARAAAATTTLLAAGLALNLTNLLGRPWRPRRWLYWLAAGFGGVCLLTVTGIGWITHRELFSAARSDPLLHESLNRSLRGIAAIAAGLAYVILSLLALPGQTSREKPPPEDDYVAG